MEDKILAHEAENVGVTTEPITEQVEPAPKVYTEEEFNKKFDEAVGKKIARTEAKIRKEYDRKYGALTDVLKAGTGKEDLAEMTDTFKKFYTQRGVKFPSEPTYSSKDIEILARAEANDIISLGYEDVVEEVDRLTSIGFENMTPKEKQIFKALAEHRQSAERGQELSKIGVTEAVYNSKEFKDFSAKFSAGTPVTEIYDIYSRMQPQKEVHTAGSMKSINPGKGNVKDFYSYEEALKFTKEDFDKNPALFRAVENSMLKW